MSVDELLARIQSVIESDWTGDLFCAVRGRKQALVLIAGDPDDAEMYFAVKALVETWDCRTNEAESYHEYMRPQ